jgi:Flp pilus assembly protein TadG
MRWLTDEEGATAVIIALLLVPLIGFGAIVIDVGLIYWETRQLQNGADAAALAIAQECVDDDYGDCGPYQATADDFTDFNANDGRADAAVQLPGLDGPNSVTVTATTRTADDSNRLSYALAGVLGTDFNETFARSATARWSGIGSVNTIPLTFSKCEWDFLTGGSLENLPTANRIVYFHSSQTAKEENSCGGPANQNHPGGFGWLKSTGDNVCEAEVVMGNVSTDTGNNVPNDCTSAYMQSLVGQTVLMPIFDQVTSQGSNATYRIIGFAAVEISGFRFSGNKEFNYPGNEGPCSGNDRCIQGRFVAYYDLSEVPDDNAPSFGVYTIGLSR